MEITLKDISKSYSGKSVIKDLSLGIESGSFTTLLGPSGCGKTTLLRMISGLETPDEGEILFDGKPVFSSFHGISVPPEKRGLGFVFQDFALWPHMSVFENVAFGLRARKDTADIESRVMDALSKVKLEAYSKSRPSELSGGQQQRVAFARAIVTKPECILFDEPLSALDALLREEMRKEIKAIVSELGTTAVFVTHDQAEAMCMSNKIAVMSDGVIEQYGSPEEIYSSPKGAFVSHFIGSGNWINSTSMFRPEDASLGERKGAMKFNVSVSGSEFHGSSYILSLDCEGRKWTMATRKKIEKGTLMPIYIMPGDIVRV